METMVGQGRGSMRRIALVLIQSVLIGFGMTSCSAKPPLPGSQRITSANAGSVQLLKTLSIPGFTKGAVSQSSIAFSPDGRLLIGACGINQVPIWDVQSGVVRHLFYDGTRQIAACDFSPDGKVIACGGFDQTITLWDADTGQKVRDLGSTESPVWELDFSADGKKLVSCTVLDDIRLWDVAQNTII